MKRLRCALFACALTSAMGVLAGPAITATGPYQPFISTSYWRTPSSAPADAKSGAKPATDKDAKKVDPKAAAPVAPTGATKTDAGKGDAKTTEKPAETKKQ